jgi:hypothetical protein
VHKHVNALRCGGRRNGASHRDSTPHGTILEI